MSFIRGSSANYTWYINGYDPDRTAYPCTFAPSFGVFEVCRLNPGHTNYNASYTCTVPPSVTSFTINTPVTMFYNNVFLYLEVTQGLNYQV